jgi:hypothetical protein
MHVQMLTFGQIWFCAETSSTNFTHDLFSVTVDWIVSLQISLVHEIFLADRTFKLNANVSSPHDYSEPSCVGKFCDSECSIHLHILFYGSGSSFHGWNFFCSCHIAFFISNPVSISSLLRRASSLQPFKNKSSINNKVTQSIQIHVYFLYESQWRKFTLLGQIKRCKSILGTDGEMTLTWQWL